LEPISTAGKGNIGFYIYLRRSTNRNKLIRSFPFEDVMRAGAVVSEGGGFGFSGDP
jgi:hypothetical protein